MRYLILPIVLLAAGCTTSAAGLARSDVKMSLASAKEPKIVATCSAESMIGNVQLRDDGTNYWLLRINGYGVPIARWDFKPNGSGGAAIELRSSININSGDERVKACL